MHNRHIMYYIPHVYGTRQFLLLDTSRCLSTSCTGMNCKYIQSIYKQFDNVQIQVLYEIYKLHTYICCYHTQLSDYPYVSSHHYILMVFPSHDMFTLCRDLPIHNSPVWHVCSVLLMNIGSTNDSLELLIPWYISVPHRRCYW